MPTVGVSFVRGAKRLGRNPEPTVEQLGSLDPASRSAPQGDARVVASRSAPQGDAGVVASRRV